MVSHTVKASSSVIMGLTGRLICVRAHSVALGVWQLMDENMGCSDNVKG